jgi:putative spermidine/putrescine transport system substrate-binding protein
MYRTDKVSPAPTSWAPVFQKDSPYKGHITAYDSPIYLADAALYLMKTQPALGIKNPYALDQKQFDAAVALLKQQNANIGEYWSDYLKEVSAFKSGDSLLGTTWQVIANTAQSEKTPVKAVLPSEGATGWSDTWMLYSKAKHPNCAYAWMNWIVSPQVNAQVAEYFGEAPANKLACAHTASKTFCDDYHAGDAAYYRRVWFWTTPIPQCVDGRQDVTCVPYAKWAQAWTSIKG